MYPRKSSLSSTTRIRDELLPFFIVSIRSSAEHVSGCGGAASSVFATVMKRALRKCLFPMGNVTRTQVPSPSVLDIKILPLCKRTSCRPASADSASRHFLINGIAAPEKPSAQIFPLPGGNSNPRITYLYAPCILFSVGTNMDITISGGIFQGI